MLHYKIVSIIFFVNLLVSVNFFVCSDFDTFLNCNSPFQNVRNNKGHEGLGMSEHSKSRILTFKSTSFLVDKFF